MWDLQECQRSTGEFSATVQQVAHAHGVEPRLLKVRALLQLPLLADYAGRVNKQRATLEVRSTAIFIADERKKMRSLFPEKAYLLEQLRFQEIDRGKAEGVFNSLHYLRHARKDSLNFGLVDPDGYPVAICSASTLEWRGLGNLIKNHFDISPDRIRDLSRVYCFETAPKNAVSTLLAGVRRVMRDEGVDLLTTAVDPNLGFNGISYRAANWQEWLVVDPRPFLYYDGVYRTPRSLREEFPEQTMEKLKEPPARRLRLSRAQLQNSLVFCQRTRGATEALAAPIRLRR